MSADGISDEVRQFIFESIDSIEQLEVLLFLHKHSDRYWSVLEITSEFRSSQESIASRLMTLEALDLVEQNQQTPMSYRYQPKSPKLKNLIIVLAETYALRRHKVMELIFSPSKRARSFADAFRVTKPPKKIGDNNG